MRFASRPQPGQLSLFDLEASPATPMPPRVAEPSPSPAPPIATPALMQHPRAQREIVLRGHRVAYEFRVARRRSIGFSVGARQEPPLEGRSLAGELLDGVHARQNVS